MVCHLCEVPSCKYHVIIKPKGRRIQHHAASVRESPAAEGSGNELDDFSLGSEAGFGADPLVVASKACRPNNLNVMKAILLGSLAMP